MAAELDVARTPTRLAAVASRNESPTKSFSTGTSSTPPPMPTSAPRQPATTPPRSGVTSAGNAGSASMRPQHRVERSHDRRRHADLRAASHDTALQRLDFDALPLRQIDQERRTRARRQLARILE